MRISYCCDGRIHVAEPGQPEGQPLTTGHWDFKPSWSKTGDKLVFYRRNKDDPVTVNWLSAICIRNVDGTGFHQYRSHGRALQSDMDAGREEHADWEPQESKDRRLLRIRPAFRPRS